MVRKLDNQHEPRFPRLDSARRHRTEGALFLPFTLYFSQNALAQRPLKSANNTLTRKSVGAIQSSFFFFFFIL